jgi:hypothetical protein
MKKFIAVIAGTVLALSGMSGMEPRAEEPAKSEPTVAGDVNSDGKFDENDLEALQKYLLGKYKLSVVGYACADFNSDGRVDCFDLALCRKKYVELTKGIIKRVNMTMIGYSSGWFENVKDKETVVTSVDELKAFFAVPEDIDEYYAKEIAEEEKAYLKKYDEVFFDNYVLCLAPVYQGGGGGIRIQSVKFGDDSITISYNEAFSMIMIHDPILNIAQVAIPKSMYSGEEVKWTYYSPETQADVNTEYTRKADISVWKQAIKGDCTFMAESAEELEQAIKGKFGSAVERDILRKYGEKYFEKNDLVISVYAECARDDIRVYSPHVELYEDSFTIEYNIDYVDGSYSDDRLMINEIELPKDRTYHGKPEVVVRPFEKDRQASHEEYDICWLVSDIRGDIVNSYENKGKWVYSQEEFDAYLRECFTEEGLAQIDKYAKYHGGPAYMWLDGDIIGSKHEMLSAYSAGGTIMLNLCCDMPLGDEAGSFLHVFYPDPENAGMNVKTREFSLDEDYDPIQGKLVRLDTDNGTFFVEQYGFGDEYSADIYITAPGGGPIEFRSMKVIASLELSNAYFPFSEDYTTEETAAGITVLKGENFTAECTDGVLILSYRTSEDSEMSTVEIPISNPS